VHGWLKLLFFFLASFLLPPSLSFFALSLLLFSVKNADDDGKAKQRKAQR
jgi:hypothetical protein